MYQHSTSELLRGPSKCENERQSRGHETLADNLGALDELGSLPHSIHISCLDNGIGIEGTFRLDFQTFRLSDFQTDFQATFRQGRIQELIMKGEGVHKSIALCNKVHEGGVHVPPVPPLDPLLNGIKLVMSCTTRQKLTEFAKRLLKRKFQQ